MSKLWDSQPCGPTGLFSPLSFLVFLVKVEQAEQRSKMAGDGIGDRRKDGEMYKWIEVPM